MPVRALRHDSPRWGQHTLNQVRILSMPVRALRLCLDPVIGPLVLCQNPINARKGIKTGAPRPDRGDPRVRILSMPVRALRLHHSTDKSSRNEPCVRILSMPVRALRRLSNAQWRKVVVAVRILSMPVRALRRFRGERCVAA